MSNQQNNPPDAGVCVKLWPLLDRQLDTEVEFDGVGNMTIRQTPHAEGGWIFISRDNIDTFIDRLTDAMGIPSFGKPE